MNHSCDPNVIVVSCFNSYLIRVIAIKEIKQVYYYLVNDRYDIDYNMTWICQGDELCFSYIDEEAPFEERQRQLQELYLFQCRCEKCKLEAKIHDQIKRRKGGPASGSGGAKGSGNKNAQQQQQKKKKNNAKKRKGGKGRK